MKGIRELVVYAVIITVAREKEEPGKKLGVVDGGGDLSGDPVVEETTTPTKKDHKIYISRGKLKDMGSEMLIFNISSHYLVFHAGHLVKIHRLLERRKWR